MIWSVDHRCYIRLSWSFSPPRPFSAHQLPPHLQFPIPLLFLVNLSTTLYCSSLFQLFINTFSLPLSLTPSRNYCPLDHHKDDDHHHRHHVSSSRLLCPGRLRSSFSVAALSLLSDPLSPPQQLYHCVVSTLTTVPLLCIYHIGDQIIDTIMHCNNAIMHLWTNCSTTIESSQTNVIHSNIGGKPRILFVQLCSSQEYCQQWAV